MIYEVIYNSEFNMLSSIDSNNLMSLRSQEREQFKTCVSYLKLSSKLHDFPKLMVNGWGRGYDSHQIVDQHLLSSSVDPIVKSSNLVKHKIIRKKKEEVKPRTLCPATITDLNHFCIEDFINMHTQH